MSMFKFDEKALRKLADEAVEKHRPKIQAELDRLAKSHKGKSVAEIKRVLRQRIGAMDDRSLTNIVEAIAAGTSVRTTRR